MFTAGLPDGRHLYVAVITILLGQTLLFASTPLLIGTSCLWAAMAAFVGWYEEPVLAARYGQQYEDYRANVRSWRPRLTPWASRHEQPSSAAEPDAESP